MHALTTQSCLFMLRLIAAPQGLLLHQAFWSLMTTLQPLHNLQPQQPLPACKVRRP